MTEPAPGRKRLRCTRTPYLADLVGHQSTCTQAAQGGREAA